MRRLLLTVSIVAAFALFGLVLTGEIESGQLEERCGWFLSHKFFGHGNKTEFDDYPWMALLVYDTPKGKANGCGGVLLSKRYVLTAAHCVARLGGQWNLTTVRLGEYNTETDVDCYPDNDNEVFCAPNAQEYGVDQLIPHEEYGPGSRAHDIALIRLNDTISQFSDFLRPICLPTQPSIPQRFHVAGWGRLAGRKGSTLKLRSALNQANTSQCVELYDAEGIKMADDQICAGNWTKDSLTWDQEPCVADSGGPLMGIEKTPQRHRMTVFGLLTMDSKFCAANKRWPAMYVDVFKYKDWILQRVKE